MESPQYKTSRITLNVSRRPWSNGHNKYLTIQGCFKTRVRDRGRARIQEFDVSQMCKITVLSNVLGNGIGRRSVHFLFSFDSNSVRVCVHVQWSKPLLIDAESSTKKIHMGVQ